MYWILVVMGLLVAVVLAVLVGGLATPRKHVVRRSVVIGAPPDRVWVAIRDVARFPEWRDDMIDAEVLNGYGGLAWREISSAGSVAYAVVEEDTPRMMTARVLDDDHPFAGTWTWMLDATDGNTRVTLTQRGEIGNPLVRFARSIRGYDKDIAAYLESLTRFVQ